MRERRRERKKREKEEEGEMVRVNPGNCCLRETSFPIHFSSLLIHYFFRYFPLLLLFLSLRLPLSLSLFPSFSPNLKIILCSFTFHNFQSNFSHFFASNFTTLSSLPPSLSLLSICLDIRLSSLSLSFSLSLSYHFLYCFHRIETEWLVMILVPSLPLPLVDIFDRFRNEKVIPMNRMGRGWGLLFLSLISWENEQLERKRERMEGCSSSHIFWLRNRIALLFDLDWNVISLFLFLFLSSSLPLFPFFSLSFHFLSLSTRRERMKKSFPSPNQWLLLSILSIHRPPSSFPSSSLFLTFSSSSSSCPLSLSLSYSLSQRLDPEIGKIPFKSSLNPNCQ